MAYEFTWRRGNGRSKNNFDTLLREKKKKKKKKNISEDDLENEYRRKK